MYLRKTTHSDIRWEANGQIALGKEAVARTEWTGVSSIDEINEVSPPTIGADVAKDVKENFVKLQTPTLRVTEDDGVITNDGSDTETITVELVDTLEISRGTDASDATVRDVDATVVLSVDSAEYKLSVTDGSGTKDITTTKSSGTTISVQATEIVGKSYHASSEKLIEVTS